MLQNRECRRGRGGRRPGLANLRRPGNPGPSSLLRRAAARGARWLGTVRETKVAASFDPAAEDGRAGGRGDGHHHLRDPEEAAARAVPHCPGTARARHHAGPGVRAARPARAGCQAVALGLAARATAWRRVKEALAAAGIEGAQASPKGLRYALGVAAVGEGIPLDLVQRWMGHTQLTTTAIYAEAVGEKERSIAARMWR